MQIWAAGQASRRVVWKRIAAAASFAAAGFVLGQICLIKMMCPFGPAFIAACFLAHRQERFLAAAGVLLGALLAGDQTLAVVTATASVTAALIAMRKHVDKRWAVMLAVAGACLLSALVFHTQSAAAFMTALLGALIALMMVYVFQTLIALLSSRRRSVLTREETICLTLGGFSLVCALGPLHVSGVYIANIAAMAMTAAAAYAGGGALGAGVGLALGAACCIGIGAQPAVVGMLGAAGMAAGTLRKLKKPGSVLSFFIVCLLFVLAFFPAVVWPLVIIEAAIAAVLFAAVPKKALNFCARHLDARARAGSEYQLHTRRYKEMTAKRLREVSQAFAQTGELFAQQAQPAEEDRNIANVLALIAEGTCKDCVFKKSCWQKDFTNTYNVLHKLFRAYEKKGCIARADFDTAFAKKCFNTAGIIRTAESVFKTHHMSAQYRRKIEASRRIAGKQLQGVAQVVSDIGREMGRGFTFLSHIEQRVAVSLDAAGIRVMEVCAERSFSGGMRVVVKVKDCGGQRGIERVEAAVGQACGVRMKCAGGHTCAEGRPCTLHFEQARRLAVHTGVAKLAKGEVSGDSHAFAGLPGGRYMLMLADGMGSGESARSESAAAVALAENFYAAGFNDAVIFDTINRLLMLKSSDDMFTTVDLTLIDLHSGQAQFTKIGAECAFILRSGEVQTVQPGALPMGIVEDMRPKSTKKTLAEGDMIVMMSDGVSGAINAPPEVFFDGMAQLGVQEAADAIMAKALPGGKPEDDMTVMVTRLVEENDGAGAFAADG